MLAHKSGGSNPAPGSFLNCSVALGKTRLTLGRRDEVFNLASWAAIVENPSLFGRKEFGGPVVWGFLAWKLSWSL